ncbi:hypothetical protein JL101_028155 [Skermanella rosea]|uniref:hypothetical protein n=1 Tax=Skermanella rosea TaxID=1817965 RepID=UPI001931478B|nr:hypothetical protein [Skermanella rosea]UEM03773.1 hypothetical protein JL101_028155 [Skermanella rosea]
MASVRITVGGSDTVRLDPAEVLTGGSAFRLSETWKGFVQSSWIGACEVIHPELRPREPEELLLRRAAGEAWEDFSARLDRHSGVMDDSTENDPGFSSIDFLFFQPRPSQAVAGRMTEPEIHPREPGDRDLRQACDEAWQAFLGDRSGLSRE